MNIKIENSITFRNVLNNVIMSFPNNSVDVPHKIYKALKAIDSERVYTGSFYHMINGDRKQMGNWRLV